MSVPNKKDLKGIISNSVDIGMHSHMHDLWQYTLLVPLNLMIFIYLLIICVIHVSQQQITLITSLLYFRLSSILLRKSSRSVFYTNTGSYLCYLIEALLPRVLALHLDNRGCNSQGVTPKALEERCKLYFIRGLNPNGITPHYLGEGLIYLQQPWASKRCTIMLRGLSLHRDKQQS